MSAQGVLKDPKQIKGTPQGVCHGRTLPDSRVLTHGDGRINNRRDGRERGTETARKRSNSTRRLKAGVELGVKTPGEN